MAPCKEQHCEAVGRREAVQVPHITEKSARPLDWAAQKQRVNPEPGSAQGGQAWSSVVCPGARTPASAGRGRGARQALGWSIAAGTRGLEKTPPLLMGVRIPRTEKMQEFVLAQPRRSRSMSFIEENCSA